MLEIRQLLVCRKVLRGLRDGRGWGGAEREEGKKQKTKDAHLSLEQVYEIGNTLGQILFSVNGT